MATLKFFQFESSENSRSFRASFSALIARALVSALAFSNTRQVPVFALAHVPKNKHIF